MRLRHQEIHSIAQRARNEPWAEISASEWAAVRGWLIT